MLEVGCAQSSWLPYFHFAFGCRVAGIDYSPTGCRMSRQLLDEAGVPGEVLERDLFADNSDLEGTFDFLFSLGFIEFIKTSTDEKRYGGNAGGPPVKSSWSFSAIPTVCRTPPSSRTSSPTSSGRGRALGPSP